LQQFFEKKPKQFTLKQINKKMEVTEEELINFATNSGFEELIIDVNEKPRVRDSNGKKNGNGNKPL
jgi:hypothetical protein